MIALSLAERPSKISSSMVRIEHNNDERISPPGNVPLCHYEVRCPDIAENTLNNTPRSGNHAVSEVRSCELVADGHSRR